MLLQLSLATAALATVRRQLSSDYYTVEEGDFCLQIISEYGNQISLETLYRNNPSINRNNCENLQIGQILYIGSGQAPAASASTVGACQSPHVVKEGEFCFSILDSFGNSITLAQLYQTNPAINSQCTNLTPNQVICLDGVNSAASVVPAQCSRFYTVEDGDVCFGVAQDQGISVGKLYNLNPSINSGCSNLSIGQKICVSANFVAAPVAPASTTMAPAANSPSASSTVVSVTPVQAAASSASVAPAPTSTSSAMATSSAVVESSPVAAAPSASASATLTISMPNPSTQTSTSFGSASTTLASSTVTDSATVTPASSTAAVASTSSESVIATSSTVASSSMVTSSTTPASTTVEMAATSSALATSTDSMIMTTSTKTVPTSSVASDSVMATSTIAATSTVATMETVTQSATLASSSASSTPTDTPVLSSTTDSTAAATTTAQDPAVTSTPTSSNLGGFQCPPNATVDSNPSYVCDCSTPPFYDQASNSCLDCPADLPVYVSDYNACCPMDAPHWDPVLGGCIAYQCPDTSNPATSSPGLCDCVTLTNVQSGLTFYDVGLNICTAPAEVCPIESSGLFPLCDCSATLATDTYDTTNNICVPSQCPAAGSYPFCNCEVNGDGTTAYDFTSNTCYNPANTTLVNISPAPVPTV